MGTVRVKVKRQVTRRDARCVRRSTALVGAAWCLSQLLGCVSSAPRPIFPAVDPPLGWPAPPQLARIRYVGAITGEADLKRARRPFAVLGELLVGKKQPQPLYGPRAVVVSSDGQRVWVADPGGRCLHLFDLGSRGYKRVVSAGGTPLLMPVAMCLGPDESIFVADSERVAIYRLSAQDGSLLSSLHLPVELLRPASVAFNESTGELWVADAAGHDLKVLALDGTFRRTVGKRGSAPGEFNFPCDLAITRSAVWVADAGNHRVQALNDTGDPAVSFGKVGDASGDLALPKAIAADVDGNVYVVDGRFENVQIFDPSGTLLLYLGEEGRQPGQFWLPSDIFIEPGGRIWICDSYNRRIQVFERVRPAEAPPDVK